MIKRLPIRLTFDHGIFVACEDLGESPYSYPYSYSVYTPYPSECPFKPQNDSGVAFVNPPCEFEDPCEQQQ